LTDLAKAGAETVVGVKGSTWAKEKEFVERVKSRSRRRGSDSEMGLLVSGAILYEAGRTGWFEAERANNK
jgi:hypothetical protein